MIIDTLVPQSLKSSGSWVAQANCTTPANSGTLVANTSDGIDTTFARLVTGGGFNTNTLQLSLGTHTEPANHQRHLIRINARWNRVGVVSTGASGTVRMRGARINSPSGGFFTFADLTTSGFSGPACTINPRSTAWSAVGITAQVAVEFLYLVNRDTFHAELAPAELSMEIDNRHKPTFTPQVLDGARDPSVLITDTTTPSFRFQNIEFDGLNGREWQVFLYTEATTLLPGFGPFNPAFTAVDTFEGSGPPPARVDGQPIANGNYVAYFRAYSTIRVNDAFTSDIESVAFTMNITPPDPPDIVVTYDPADDIVEACFQLPSPPGAVTFDAGTIVTEIQRSDCDSGGFVTVAVVDETDGCWDDCVFPYARDGFCSIPDHDCVLTYRARNWGLLDGILIATDWSTEDTAEVPYPYGENDRLRTFGCVTAIICPDRSWSRSRPFGAFQPIGGGRPTVVTGDPGGRDYTLTFPVSDIDPSLPNLADIEAVLAEMTVHYAPTDLPSQWMAPDTESIQVVKVGRLRSYTVSFVATGPPVVATPESFFPDE